MVRQAVCHYKVPAGAIAIKFPGGMKLYARFGIKHKFVPQAHGGSDPMCLHHTGVDCPIIIEDTKQCKRVENDVLVASEPYVRFFAGAPIKQGTMVFGTLCIFDWTPRVLRLVDSDMLNQLACQISASYADWEKSKGVRIDSNQSPTSLFSTIQGCLSDTDSQEILSNTENEEGVSELYNGEDWQKEAQTEAKSSAAKSRLKFISEATTAVGGAESSGNARSSDSEPKAESSGNARSSDSEPTACLRSHTWHSGFDGSTPCVRDWSRRHLSSASRSRHYMPKRSFTEGDTPCTDAGQALAIEKTHADTPSMQPSLDSKLRPVVMSLTEGYKPCTHPGQALAIEKTDADTPSMQPSLDSKLRPEMSPLEFLQLLGLEKCHPAFQKEEIDMHSLQFLSDEDLASLGIKMGPRRKIQAAIRGLVFGLK
eukprot:CAMPEP_0197708628 /NCGR_PEP_ID=MMETSP1338-20131121/128048_1 /TAXON_ID=43686 ORGANISM="Pelagodinium beii, Strain RCC1491" /NCGR_SAMPLE_ID=MMETSP1338 /ASSEMBLY_ACC=CAM_ASM_000754 /LENGTH=424 /DNA_ID=CAMNT_0043292559 /DNA_START=107 /DNA_END=1381 /DNA_ORIENTATION=+